MNMSQPANIERFSGFASDYDAVRPQLPEVATDVLREIVERTLPDLVVDLGSGTGRAGGAYLQDRDRDARD